MVVLITPLPYISAQNDADFQANNLHSRLVEMVNPISDIPHVIRALLRNKMLRNENIKRIKNLDNKKLLHTIIQSERHAD